VTNDVLVRALVGVVQAPISIRIIVIVVVAADTRVESLGKRIDSLFDGIDDRAVIVPLSVVRPFLVRLDLALDAAVTHGRLLP